MNNLWWVSTLILPVLAFLIGNEYRRLEQNQPTVVSSTDVNWQGGTYRRVGKANDAVRVRLDVDTRRLGPVQACVTDIRISVNDDAYDAFTPVLSASDSRLEYPQPAASTVLILDGGKELTVGVEAMHLFRERQSDWAIGQILAQSLFKIRPGESGPMAVYLELPEPIIDEAKLRQICSQ